MSPLRIFWGTRMVDLGNKGVSVLTQKTSSKKKGSASQRTVLDQLSRREEIINATRYQMLNGGTDAVTIRGVASRAGVDPALVYHYFGSKEGLLQASQQLPFDPQAIIPTLLESGRSNLGTRLIRTLLTVLDSSEAMAPMSFLFRMAFANPGWEENFKDMVIESFVKPIAELHSEYAERRSSAAAVTIVGLIWARYVNRMPSIDHASVESLSSIFGPVLGID